MPTIPTGALERALRALYLRWIRGLAFDSNNLYEKLASFDRRALALIEQMGGQVAALGAYADFPVPKTLDLSPWAGRIYTDMEKAAVAASITAGLNSRDAARAMFRAGTDKAFRSVERLARTETVSAYWKNAFRSVEGLPELVMLWGSEDGPRTCQWCRERDGLVMDSPNLRDHPNGRCTPIPTLRFSVAYRGSIDANGDIYQDPRWRDRNRDFQGGRTLVNTGNTP